MSTAFLLGLMLSSLGGLIFIWQYRSYRIQKAKQAIISKSEEKEEKLNSEENAWQEPDLQVMSPVSEEEEKWEEKKEEMMEKISELATENLIIEEEMLELKEKTEELANKEEELVIKETELEEKTLELKEELSELKAEEDLILENLVEDTLEVAETPAVTQEARTEEVLTEETLEEEQMTLPMHNVDYTKDEESLFDIKKEIKRAEVLLSAGDEIEAEKVLVSILAIDQKHIDAHILLASLYLKRKQYSRAEVLYRELVNLQKYKQAGTLSNLAFCLFEQGRVNESIDFYQLALNVDDGNYKRYTNLAQVYFVTKDFLQAIELFKKALRLKPRDTDVLFMLADTYREAHMFLEAKKSYLKVLDYEPYNHAAQEEVDRFEQMGY
mgnify:CR=1 FL=1